MVYDMSKIFNDSFIDFIWNALSEYNEYDDDRFNASATSKKITSDYNLVVWCDIDDIGRYYIISIRYNPYDDLFGDDIGAEWDTADTSKEELINGIRKVAELWELKQM